MADEPNAQGVYADAPLPGAQGSAGARPAPNRALAEQYLQRGLDSYERQDLEGALASYQQALQADPTFAVGFNSIGVVLIDMERYDEAVQVLYEAIRRDAAYAEAYSNLGFVLRRLQRNMEAASAYGRFLELEPDIEEGPRIRSWISTTLQQNNLADVPPFALPGEEQAPDAGGSTAEPPAPVEPAAEAAASVPLPETVAPPEPVVPPMPAAPEMAAAPALLSAPAADAGADGVAAFFAAAEQGAAAAPAQAQEAAPKIKKMSGWEIPVSSDVAAVTGAVAPPAAAPVEAAMPVSPAPSGAPAETGATPETAVAVIERGMDLFAEGNLTEAAATFHQAMQEFPACAEAHVGLAKVWLRQEKLVEAIEVLQKAATMDPQDPACLYVLGFAFRAVDRNTEAAQAYGEFLRLMPDALDGAKIRDWIGQVKQVTGQASGTYEEVVVDDEQIVTELDKRYKDVMGKFQEGDVDVTIRQCIRILNEDAGHVRSRVLLGRAYLRQKAYDNAIEQLENSLVTRPDHPEALYFLGQAAEKRGVHDKAVNSYKRYLTAAPTGPRAERIREWLLAHSGPAAGSGDGKQAQCEICLRYFPEGELAQHEGRTTCGNCLAVMGGAPALSTPELVAAAEGPPPAPVRAPTEALRPQRSKGVVLVLAALLMLTAAGGGLYYLGHLNPVLERVGLRKPQEKKKPLPPPPPPPPKQLFDASKVKIANEPAAKQARLFVPWSYKPEVTGHGELDTVAPGWKKRYSLKDAPPGMAIAEETGEIKWTPEISDDAALKKGRNFTVEVTVKGTGTGPEGQPKEFFSVAKTVLVTCQFGYELGPELDLGLGPADRPVIACTDLNGDGLVDTVVGIGRFRDGSLRLHLQRRNVPLPPPTELARGARVSALWAGNLDGVAGDDLVAADWHNGRLKLFCQDAQGLTPRGELPVQPGTIALGAGDVTGDQRPEIAALSSIARTLDVVTVTPERGLAAAAAISGLPSAGSAGIVLQWTSAEAGEGFVAVAPLSDAPLRFVPCNKGRWPQDGTTAIASPVKEDGVVAAAAVVTGPEKASSRLALVVAGKTSRLVIMREQGGKFTAAGPAVVLPSLGLNLLAHDFNQDGHTDLLAVMLEECAFYFARGEGFARGPRIAAPTRLLGQAVRFAAGPTDRPEILLVNENRKAQFLKPVEPELPPPEAPPAEKTDKAAVEQPAPAKADGPPPAQEATPPAPAGPPRK